MEKPALEIIEAFGGLTKMAHALGHKHVTTVQSWKETGRIPRWRVWEIEHAADRHGVKLSRAARAYLKNKRVA